MTWAFANKIKCQLSTQPRLPLHQEIHLLEVLLQVILTNTMALQVIPTNNTVALQIRLGSKGGIIY